MLPDLPSLKKDIHQMYLAAYKHRVNVHLGVVNEAPRHFIKEGHGLVTVRADKTEEETELKTASAEMVIDPKKVPDLSTQERLRMFEDMARDMAAQISTHAFDVIGKATEAVGNVVDAKKRALSPELILEALEKMQLDFDEQGQLKNLKLVLSPEAYEGARAALMQLEHDPAYRKAHSELLQKKWMEWRDREAARKLVG